MVAHTVYFSSLFANANNYLCQERLLRSMNFASIVISLRGRRLKGKGQGVLGARET